VGPRAEVVAGQGQGAGGWRARPTRARAISRPAPNHGTRRWALQPLPTTHTAHEGLGKMGGDRDRGVAGCAERVEKGRRARTEMSRVKETRVFSLLRLEEAHAADHETRFRRNTHSSISALSLPLIHIHTHRIGTLTFRLACTLVKCILGMGSPPPCECLFHP
jgi:hypothetical protein